MTEHTERPAVTYATRGSKRVPAAPGADLYSGAGSLVALFVVGGFTLLFGLFMALGRTALMGQVFGCTLLIVAAVFIAGGLVVSALRK